MHAVDVIGEELAAVVAGINDGGGFAAAAVVDLARPEEIESAFAGILGAEGRVDCLANVAGVISDQPIEETSLAEWNRILDINLRGTFACARAVAPAMKRRRAGSIINVSSRAGAMGFAGMTAYCASKFGVEGLSRALARELAPYGVAVNTITPGHPVHTAMSETTYTPDKRAIWKDPSEIAPAFVHLALQGPDGLNDQYVQAWGLAQELRARGAA